MRQTDLAAMGMPGQQQRHLGRKIGRDVRAMSQDDFGTPQIVHCSGRGRSVIAADERVVDPAKAQRADVESIVFENSNVCVAQGGHDFIAAAPVVVIPEYRNNSERRIQTCQWRKGLWSRVVPG
jgi:hypothetical protein